MPGHRWLGVAAVDDEIMALGLARNRFVDRRLEQRVIRACPQWRAQMSTVVLAEAHIKCAGAGEPHAVAALAEIMSHRRDEAEAAASLTHGVVTRRAARAVIGLIERPAPLQRCAHHR